MLYGIQNEKNSQKGEESSKEKKSKLHGKTSQKRKNP